MTGRGPVTSVLEGCRVLGYVGDFLILIVVTRK